MTIAFRDAGPADAPAVAALHIASWRAAYRGILPDAYLADALAEEKTALWRAKLGALEPEDLVILAEEAGALVGFIAVWPDPALAAGAFIDNLHAAPERRRRGIGEALMRRAAARLLAAGRRQAWLTVFPENLAAVRFYESMGGRRGLDMAAEIGGRTYRAVAYYWTDLAELGAPAA